MRFLDTIIMGNTVAQWFFALVLGAGAFLVLRMTLTYARRWIRAYAPRPVRNVADILVQALDHTTVFFLFMGALYLAAGALTLGERPRAFVDGLAVITVLFQAGRWVSAAFGAWLARYTERVLKADRGAATTMVAL